MLKNCAFGVSTLPLIVMLLLSFGLVSGNVSANTGDTYALLVGVDIYEQETISPLPGALNDVTDVMALLKEFGVPSENIKVLKSSEATKTAIEQAFRQQFIDRNLQKSDVAIFYYAGHGDGVRGSGSSINFLTAYDTKISYCDRKPCNYSEESGFTDLSGVENILVRDEISKMIDKVKAGTFVSLIDSCHSFRVTRSPSLSRSIKPQARSRSLSDNLILPAESQVADANSRIVDNNTFESHRSRSTENNTASKNTTAPRRQREVDKSPSDKAIIELYAAHLDEKAWEPKEVNRGLFTLALTTQLRKLNRDTVTLHDMEQLNLFEGGLEGAKEPQHPVFVKTAKVDKGHVILSRSVAQPTTVVAPPLPTKKTPSFNWNPSPLAVAIKRDGLSFSGDSSIEYGLKSLIDRSSFARLVDSDSRAADFVILYGTNSDSSICSIVVVEAEREDITLAIRLHGQPFDIDADARAAISNELKRRQLVANLTQLSRAIQGESVRLSLDRSTRSKTGQPVVAVGEELAFLLRSRVAGYLTILQMDALGNLDVFFPNDGNPQKLPPSSQEFSFGNVKGDEPEGQSYFLTIVSPEPIDVKQLHPSWREPRCPLASGEYSLCRISIDDWDISFGEKLVRELNNQNSIPGGSDSRANSMGIHSMVLTTLME